MMILLIHLQVFLFAKKPPTAIPCTTASYPCPNSLIKWGSVSSFSFGYFILFLIFDYIPLCLILTRIKLSLL